MSNVIIGIHGLDNKPAPEVLARGWKDAMLEGLRTNAGIDCREEDLEYVSVYWADVMYPKPDPKPDVYRPAEKGAIKRYKEGWLDVLRATISDGGGRFADEMKHFFGLDKATDAILKKLLPDLYKYYAQQTKRDELRNRLKRVLQENRDKRIMVVGHSMGSIISYDVLRSLGREEPSLRIDHYVTIGSPLGIPHVKYKIAMESKLVRTPSIVRKWTNLADRRDPVAVDTNLSGDYEANDYDVQVRDDLVLNDWGGIHHKSYGYLRTPEFTDLLRTFI